MFRSHRLSSYTGLACTFSYLIREHGVQPIHDIILDAARESASYNHNLSDALARLAIAVSSDSVKRAAANVPRVHKAWRKKTEVRLELWDGALKIADEINYKELEFFKLLEVPQLPKRFPQSTHLIITEPVLKIDNRLENFSKTIDDEFSWHPFEKFVTLEFPNLIESQVEYYDQLVSIIHSAGDETASYPFSILRPKKGAIYQIAELSEHYNNARIKLKQMRLAIEKYDEALQAELNGGRLWDNARCEIEKGLPDQLGHIIKYETIKAIEEKADSLPKEV